MDELSCAELANVTDDICDELEQVLTNAKNTLARLKARRAALERGIAGCEALIEAMEPPPPIREEQTDEYTGLRAAVAAKMFIRKSRHSQSEDDIIRELKRGGWKAKSPGAEDGDIRRALRAAVNNKVMVSRGGDPMIYDLPAHEK